VFLPALGPSLPARSAPDDDPHGSTTQRLSGFRSPSREDTPARPHAPTVIATPAPDKSGA
jgi:hypothetical protein